MRVSEMDIEVEMGVQHVRQGDHERRKKNGGVHQQRPRGRETLGTNRQEDGGSTRDRQTNILERRTDEDGKDKWTKKGLQDRERADESRRDG